MDSQYIIHTVGLGDTIQSIADLYGVEWSQLVIVNGLEYPYIDDDVVLNENINSDGVAKVGSKLVIPSSELKIPNKTNNSSAEIENYALGSDLDLFSLEETSNHVVNLEVQGQLTDDNKGDLKLVQGIANLRQQLIIRLGTTKGALLLHPEFGSHISEYIGAKSTVELLVKIKLEVQECLLGDFRVQDVTDVTVLSQDGKIYVDCIVHPIAPYSTFKLTHLYS